MPPLKSRAQNLAQAARFARLRERMARARAAALPDISRSAEDLLNATNEAAAIVRNLWLTLIGLALFIAMVTGGLTDEKLLRDATVPLPLLDNLDLPHSSFYLVAPWLLALVHVELLMHLALLGGKVRGLLKALARLPADRQEHLRTQLSNFPFTHWLARSGSEQPILRGQGLFAWGTVVLMPAGVMVFALLGFLPFQSITITWVQRLALLFDVGFLIYLWPGIARTATNRGRYWRVMAHLLPPLLPAVYIGLFAATIPEEPWELGLIRANQFFGGEAVMANGIYTCVGRTVRLQRLPDNVAVSCATALLYQTESNTQGRFHRILEVRERLVAANSPPPEALAKLSGTDLQERAEAMAKIEFLDLHKRRLRYANFTGLRLFSADLRNTDLQGARLKGAELEGARLDKANLQGANLEKARLRATHLDGAQFQGAILDSAEMQGSQVAESRLDAAVSLEADLPAPHFEGASLRNAQLQGAQLHGAQFQGARLDGAQLQGAHLDEAQFQGARLDHAHLQAVSFNGAQFQGARFTGAVLSTNSLRQIELKEYSRAQSDALIAEAQKRIANPFIQEKVKKALTQAIGRSAADFLAKDCVGDTHPACVAAIGPEFRQREAAVHGFLLCSLGAEAASILSQQWAAQVPALDSAEPDQPPRVFRDHLDAYYRALAPLVTAKDCVGKGILSDEQQHNLRSWIPEKKGQPTKPDAKPAKKKDED